MLKHRISLSRFRCVNHNLAIEKMRSTHSREDRICKFCYTNFGSYVVEDDFQFVLLCPLYNHIRSHYIQKYFSHPSRATFISVISSKSHNVIRDIAGFIYHAGKLHSLNIVWLFCTVINVLVYIYMCYMSTCTCPYNVICTWARGLKLQWRLLLLLYKLQTHLSSVMELHVCNAIHISNKTR